MVCGQRRRNEPAWRSRQLLRRIEQAEEDERRTSCLSLHDLHEHGARHRVIVADIAYCGRQWRREGGDSRQEVFGQSISSKRVARLRCIHSKLMAAYHGGM